ncbi:hypothetical protein PHYSODRAFT_323209 [Phytophthora sojae]|uniref:Uncharacterized protein n=1 Tax=Phytophthora sojae (strain P6497) TaxID=1094619 RepID=G4YJC6_PHYSP|nr:hypothetical protein PHYSODRAFT_323209 [Phytophthora sojae]EGZ29723.1 hypothetical protein PHYSODRAFT_323209 [Phytophthora sojae]|eukprot:XP_009516998.1 hypothetical protein PHYSODRAFT_323209 [Phytophthora sojae]
MSSSDAPAAPPASVAISHISRLPVRDEEGSAELADSASRAHGSESAFRTYPRRSPSPRDDTTSGAAGSGRSDSAGSSEQRRIENTDMARLLSFVITRPAPGADREVRRAALEATSVSELVCFVRVELKSAKTINADLTRRLDSLVAAKADLEERFKPAEEERDRWKAESQKSSPLLTSFQKALAESEASLKSARDSQDATVQSAFARAQVLSKEIKERNSEIESLTQLLSARDAEVGSTIRNAKAVIKHQREVILRQKRIISRNGVLPMHDPHMAVAAAAGLGVPGMNPADLQLNARLCRFLTQRFPEVMDIPAGETRRVELITHPRADGAATTPPVAVSSAGSFLGKSVEQLRRARLDMLTPAEKLRRYSNPKSATAAGPRRKPQKPLMQPYACPLPGETGHADASARLNEAAQETSPVCDLSLQSGLNLAGLTVEDVPAGDDVHSLEGDLSFEFSEVPKSAEFPVESVSPASDEWTARQTGPVSFLSGSYACADFRLCRSRYRRLFEHASPSQASGVSSSSSGAEPSFHLCVVKFAGFFFGHAKLGSLAFRLDSAADLCSMGASYQYYAYPAVASTPTTDVSRSAAPPASVEPTMTTSSSAADVSEAASLDVGSRERAELGCPKLDCNPISGFWWFSLPGVTGCCWVSNAPTPRLFSTSVPKSEPGSSWFVGSCFDCGHVLAGYFISSVDSADRSYELGCDDISFWPSTTPDCCHRTSVERALLGFAGDSGLRRYPFNSSQLVFRFIRLGLDLDAPRTSAHPLTVSEDSESTAEDPGSADELSSVDSDDLNGTPQSPSLPPPLMGNFRVKWQLQSGKGKRKRKLKHKHKHKHKHKSQAKSRSKSAGSKKSKRSASPDSAKDPRPSKRQRGLTGDSASGPAGVSAASRSTSNSRSRTSIIRITRLSGFFVCFPRLPFFSPQVLDDAKHRLANSVKSATLMERLAEVFVKIRGEAPNSACVKEGPTKFFVALFERCHWMVESSVLMGLHPAFHMGLPQPRLFAPAGVDPRIVEDAIDVDVDLDEPAPLQISSSAPVPFNRAGIHIFQGREADELGWAAASLFGPASPRSPTDLGVSTSADSAIPASSSADSAVPTSGSVDSAAEDTEAVGGSAGLATSTGGSIGLLAAAAATVEASTALSQAPLSP